MFVMSDSKKHPNYREPRMRALDLVQIQWTDGESGSHAEILGRTLNISKGGMEIEVDRHIPRGTMLRMDVALGGNIITEYQAIVRHVKVLDKKRWAVGVEFFQLSPEGYMLIEEFLRFKQEQEEGREPKG